MPTAGEDAPGISFLKEQQWSLDFGTAIVREAAVRESIRVPARLEARPGGAADVVAPIDGRLTRVVDVALGATVSPRPGARTPAAAAVGAWRPSATPASARRGAERAGARHTRPRARRTSDERGRRARRSGWMKRAPRRNRRRRALRPLKPACHITTPRVLAAPPTPKGCSSFERP